MLFDFPLLLFFNFVGSMPVVIIKEKAFCSGQGYNHLHDLVGKQVDDNMNGAFSISYTRYGLIWIITTLVFVMASLCNCATYLMSKTTDPSVSWSYDLRCFQAFAMVVYGYGCVVPFGFYLLVKYFGSEVDLIRSFSMWKYSLFIFVPSSLLLVIPVGILRWTVTLTASIASVAFVGLNLKSRVLAIVLVAAYVLQFAYAMFIKSWFFHFQL